MILSGLEIYKQIIKGNILISGFDKKRLNPNSYNLRLHNELLVYTDTIMDMKKPNKTKSIIIPEDGLTLMPYTLYLGRTVERTETHGFVPMLEGRSSIGRLGISIHVTAGFGDVGFNGFWTLEIHCIEPVRIYPFVEICQIYYHEISENHTEYSNGKYQNNDGIQASMIWREL